MLHQWTVSRGSRGRKEEWLGRGYERGAEEVGGRDI